MWKTRKFALSVAIAALTLAGVSGCQTGSRFATFGNPFAKSKPVAKAESDKPAGAKTVSHTATSDERLEDSFYESVEASRLDGTSIGHLPPGRTPKKERKVREPGPTRPQSNVPGGVGGGTPVY